ncbi:MAG: chromosomal replication initiation protein DnaA [Chloroflexi bacterium RBG_16_56_11]|nr:MAG: chromosomal replication initiation protein DnaA [Chloroflexi bacterium RBG_16_56_11]
METTKNRSAQEIWDIALGELQVQVSKPNYRTWFSKTTGLGYQNGQFVIGVPNTFAAEYLEKNQRSLIEKAVGALTCPGVQIAFQVNGKSLHQETRAGAPNTPAGTVSSHMNPNYVFDTFIEGNGNRLARAAALSVAQNPGCTYNPLFIYGGAGLGKTHLLHAIGHAAAANHNNVICTSAEQFTNEFIIALREKNTEEFRNKYRNIGMLLIDDIQFISGKEQTEESFFHTFNELHNNNRQIVITSDCPPKSMPLVEERLRSRFEWGLLVDIQPPDYETRLAILRSKARNTAAEVPPDVLELIARRNTGNIRTLEGSLNRVVAFAKLLHVIPTADIATQALEDVGKKEYTADVITPATIIKAVAASFQMTLEDLMGRKRDKDTILARRLAMYLLRKETNYSLAQIGRELGNRDAAAVTTACQKMTVDIDKSPFLTRKLRDIRQNLQPATANP